MNFKSFSIVLEGFFYWINIEKSLRLSQYQGLKPVGELMETEENIKTSIINKVIVHLYEQ